MRVLPSESTRDHTYRLMQLLATKMDSIARSELFQRYASEHGMQSYRDLFEQAKNRDQAHVEWLKEQIKRSL